jgi:hypothetical protein
MNQRTKRDRISGVPSNQRIKTQAEIRNFLSALDSYPAQFARDPALSFEDYLFSVALNAKLEEYREA